VERGRRVKVIALGAVLCGCSPPAEAQRLPAAPAQVEELTEGGARLVPLDGSSPGVMVYRWQLPAGAREGDVIVDGRVDARATEALHRWIDRKLREIERAGHPVELGKPPLTSR